MTPRKDPALYRLMVIYRSVDAATMKNMWLMPHIDAVLQDVRESTAFSGIDFTSGCWKLFTHSENQSLYAFMTHNDDMQLTQTTHVGCNSAANFQACVGPYFGELRDNLLARLDDLALQNWSESDLLNILSLFLQLCNDNSFLSLYQNLPSSPQVSDSSDD